ncbi:Kinase, CAMK CAMKL [Spironucleus salmonicida]|uniref:non-specific serine/threonine protein kinase n=1 Tax=Spironucleus salmonicida TaxID=348837 RepID=V6LP32_9EUKA|nr:Kinase, CAMK CAMKL [Spironucleus salmonicida]|eukprot:EST45998.1 Kinase, CAMK CAMKL [Spironucleus salmonicida]
MQEQIKVRVKRVANYITGKNLGRGTFGDVRLATHVISGERVAMKILEKERIQCDDDFKRVVCEIQVLKLLSHPNIVKLLEVIDTSRHIYIITEYLPQGELFNYVVSNKKLDEEEARKIFQQLISALDYCHQRNVVHRDLKLENILLDINHNCKVIDFGLSTVLQQSQSLDTACGSPSYAAPEMLTGKKYDGFKTDVWASGIVLFAMICGHLPFDDDQVDRLYKKIIVGEFTIPSHVSNEAQDLIQHILVVTPSKRFTIEDIKKHPFFTKNLPPELLINDFSAPQILDFRVVYSMVQSTPEWSALKIIKSLNNNRHNAMTAAYYLLSERRLTQGTGKWEYEEQKKYSRALGFILTEDGNIEEVQVEEDDFFGNLSVAQYSVLDDECDASESLSQAPFDQ